MLRWKVVLTTRATVFTEMLSREINQEVSRVADPTQYPVTLRRQYALDSIPEAKTEGKGPKKSLVSESETHSPTELGDDSPRGRVASPSGSDVSMQNAAEGSRTRARGSKEDSGPPGDKEQKR